MSRTSDGAAEYIPYVAACNRLRVRLGAKPYELACWVVYGAELGGLRAFRNANEPRAMSPFTFDSLGPAPAPMMEQIAEAWFLGSDLDTFDPGEVRFISLPELLARWEGAAPGTPPRALIDAEIEASSLIPVDPDTDPSSPDLAVEERRPILTVFDLKHVLGCEARWGLEPEMPTPMAAKEAGNLHRVIGAMLVLLDQHYPKQAALIAAVRESREAVPGLSQSHLERTFARARRELGGEK